MITLQIVLKVMELDSLDTIICLDDGIRQT